jgi:UDP-hydrolysing UDP-N-acetyl-D-glucosamine 2-epimerase
MQADPEINLSLIVTGMHLSPEFGLTVEDIKAEGFKISEMIEMLLSSDTPQSIAKSIGLGILGFGQAFSNFRPDILVILGDRFEMFAAAIAALPFKIPLAHIHGGELTEGAIDDAFRHSMTKLSHIHFVATNDYARRVRQLGEEPWRITVSGAPSLDNLASIHILTKHEIELKYNVILDSRPLLVTYHPVTLEFERTEWQIEEMLSALRLANMPIIFTTPNADTSGRIINQKIHEFAKEYNNAKVFTNLGTQGYFSLMAESAAVVGNSSSGIIEAPSFKLPVVNIGNRQNGRVKAKNIIDVGYLCEDILGGIRRATSPEFREGLRDLSNPYGNGNAAEIIVKRLKEIPLNDELIAKRFCDNVN